MKEELHSLPYEAFFFGSRVSGTAAARSDLDVGIEGVVPLPAQKLRSIKARVESLPTLYSIDVVDFSALTEEFKKVAKAHIEKILI